MGEADDDAAVVSVRDIAAASAGDERARTDIARRARDRVHAWCLRIVHDPDLAEDATQDTLLCMWEHLPDLRRPEAFRTWLFRIALSMCRTHLANRATRSQPSDSLEARSTPWPSSRAAVDRYSGELDDLLESLKATDRELVRMRYEEGLSSKEIAANLKTSEGAARVRLHKLVRRLRKSVGLDRGDS